MEAVKPEEKPVVVEYTSMATENIGCDETNAHVKKFPCSFLNRFLRKTDDASAFGFVRHMLIFPDFKLYFVLVLTLNS